MALSISPNGKYIAYIAEGDSSNRQSVYLYEFDSGRSRQLEGTDGATFPFWSPESDFVGFSVGGSVKRIPLKGGDAITIGTLPRDFARAIWSPDGAEMVATDGDRLYSLHPAGGKTIVRGQPPGGKSAIYPQFLASARGGWALAFILHDDAAGRGEVQVSEKNGRPHVLLPADINPDVHYEWLTYSPTGHLVYDRVLSNGVSSLWALPISSNSHSAAGNPFPIQENAAYPSVSQEGTLVYRSEATPVRKRLVWKDRSGRISGEIGEPQSDMHLPKVSPDGKFVAVEGINTLTGTNIWIHETNRQTMTRLRPDSEIASRPFWSPDGHQILFWSARKGKVTAFIQDTDGSGRTQQIAASDNFPTDWSFDGKYLLFDGDWSLQRLQDGTWDKLRNPFTGLAGTLSPDGRFVAFVSEVSGRWDLIVQAFAESGHQWQVSAGRGEQPRWSRDGKELFYVKGDTLFAVPVSTRPDFSFGIPKRLFSSSALDWGYPNPAYDVSPDGRRFVVIEPVGPVSQPAIWVVENWFAQFENHQPERR